MADLRLVHQSHGRRRRHRAGPGRDASSEVRESLRVIDCRPDLYKTLNDDRRRKSRLRNLAILKLAVELCVAAALVALAVSFATGLSIR